MKSDPTILVTGADGFVGTQVVRWLLSQGLRTAIVRRACRRTGTNDNAVADIRTTSDLFAADDDELVRLVRGTTTLIHCAWFSNPRTYLTSPVNVKCLIGSLRLCRAFVEAGGQRFVGIGTCAEYAVSSGPLDTSAQLNPSSLYAACKASAFLTISQILREAHRDFAWCRLFYLYGEGEHPDRLTPYIRQQLSQRRPVELTDGEQIRDFIDVRLAGAMIAQLATSAFSGPANICSGRGQSVREYAEGIADHYGGRDLLRFGARRHSGFDPPVVIGRPTLFTIFE